jgi:hypothetical protein
MYHDDFDVWCQRMLAEHAGWVSHLYDLFCGLESIERVHWILRTETLTDDFLALMRHVHVDVDEDAIRNLRRLNRSPIQSVAWNEQILLEVEASEHRAIHRFYDGRNLKCRQYVQDDSNVGMA